MNKVEGRFTQLSDAGKKREEDKAKTKDIPLIVVPTTHIPHHVVHQSNTAGITKKRSAQIKPQIPVPLSKKRRINKK